MAGESDLLLPVLELLPDGSYRSVLVNPKVTGKKREALIEAARRGDDLDGDQARHVRVVEYEVPDREGDGKDELIALVTTITDVRQATAAVLAQAYHQRWETGRQPAAENIPARPREGPAVRQPGPGGAGTLGLPADPLRDQRPDLRSSHRGRHRPGPDQVQADRPHPAPPGRRPGLFPLSTPGPSWHRSNPTSRRPSTSTPGAGTAPAPASSNAAATTPTASRNPGTRTSGTTAPPRSAWPTPSRPAPQHDQNKLNGIGI